MTRFQCAVDGTGRERGFSLVELMTVLAIVGVLSTILFSVSLTSYGATVESVADQLVQATSLAKLRAGATGSYQRVEVQNDRAIVWHCATPGLAAPTASCWRVVQQIAFAKQITAWDASTSVFVNPGQSVTKNASLDFPIDFKPDGTSTGGTVFVTDSGGARQWRVLVYKTTGAAYARKAW